MKLRTINTTYSEEEFQKLKALKKKAGLSWEEFITKSAERAGWE